jgi:hypothetical protein
MTLVRFAVATTTAAIPFKRLSIQDVIPTQRAPLCEPPTGAHLMNTHQPPPQTTRKAFAAPPLHLAYPNACGIDIGSTSHFVAVPADCDDNPVREFPE